MSASVKMPLDQILGKQLPTVIRSSGNVSLVQEITVRCRLLAVLFHQIYYNIIIILYVINNSICLRHISSNKPIQKRITLYSNILENVVQFMMPDPIYCVHF